MDYARITVKTFLLISAALSVCTKADQYQIDQIESAAATLDVARLSELKKEMTGYELALTHYRLSLSANMSGNAELAVNEIDNAIDVLKTLEKDTPDNVEVKALLGNVYGYKISLQPLKGIYYGPKAQSTLAKAAALEADNPRVLLFTGIAAMATPAMFGGSENKAMTAFTQAITEFDTDVNSNYHWGLAETFTWRGLVYLQQDQLNKAIADWQQALAIEPNYNWATAMIEQLEK